MRAESRSSVWGFSLIEVMIAMVIVGVVALFSARSFVGIKHSEVALRNADVCHSYLDGAFKSLDMYGVMPTMVDVLTVPSTLTYPAKNGFSDIRNAQLANIFPLHASQLVAYVDSSMGLSQLNTPVLLGGTLAMINGLYNQANPSVCTVTVNYQGVNQIITTLPENLSSTQDFNLSLTISQYDLLTGQPLLSCSSTNGKTIAPKGVSSIGTTALSKGVATLGPGVINNIGFILKLATQYTSSDRRMHNCELTHKFSYTADFEPVAAPSGLISQSLTAMRTPGYGPDSVTLDLDYNGKPGAVLFCRDVSTQHDPGDNPSNNNFGDPPINPAFPLLPAPGRKFVPCETVTLCGKTQKRNGVYGVAVFSRVDNSAKHFKMHTAWANQGLADSTNQVPPWGCIPEVEVVAVDLSGNVSNTTDVKGILLGARQDCSGSWGNCRPNSATCGLTAGVQTFAQSWPAMYGGDDCTFTTGETRTCSLGSCPVNCVGSWGTCSASCEGSQTFTIIVPASSGGLGCTNTTGDRQSCNGPCPPSPVSCSGHWTACSSACGSGSQSYLIDVTEANGGTSCSNANGDSRECTSAPCTTPSPTVPPATPTPLPTVTPAACSGVSLNGYCWHESSLHFLWSQSESCDQVCASFGGCDVSGTASIGSAGSLSSCNEVAKALNPYLGSFNHSQTSMPNGGAVGCYYYEHTDLGIQTYGYLVRDTQSVTSCSATIASTAPQLLSSPDYAPLRMCACRN